MFDSTAIWQELPLQSCRTKQSADILYLQLFCQNIHGVVHSSYSAPRLIQHSSLNFVFNLEHSYRSGEGFCTYIPLLLVPFSYSSPFCFSCLVSLVICFSLGFVELASLMAESPWSLLIWWQKTQYVGYCMTMTSTHCHELSTRVWMLW
jgi:hypothetical protein